MEERCPQASLEFDRNRRATKLIHGWISSIVETQTAHARMFEPSRAPKNGTWKLKRRGGDGNGANMPRWWKEASCLVKSFFEWKICLLPLTGTRKDFSACKVLPSKTVPPCPARCANHLEAKPLLPHPLQVDSGVVSFKVQFLPALPVLFFLPANPIIP